MDVLDLFERGTDWTAGKVAGGSAHAGAPGQRLGAGDRRAGDGVGQGETARLHRPQAVGAAAPGRRGRPRSQSGFSSKRPCLTTVTPSWVASNASATPPSS